MKTIDSIKQNERVAIIAAQKFAAGLEKLFNDFNSENPDDIPFIYIMPECMVTKEMNGIPVYGGGYYVVLDFMGRGYVDITENMVLSNLSSTTPQFCVKL